MTDVVSALALALPNMRRVGARFGPAPSVEGWRSEWRPIVRVGIGRVLIAGPLRWERVFFVGQAGNDYAAKMLNIVGMICHQQTPDLLYFFWLRGIRSEEHTSELQSR